MTAEDNVSGAEAHPEDFDALVEEHGSLVYNVAYRMMGNHEEAEDVAQDAFLSAYRAYDRFRGQSWVSTWLCRIAVNAALMRLRKTKRDRTLTQTGLDDLQIADWTTTPERGPVNEELKEKLQAGIVQIEPDLRAAVVLRDVQGFNNSEAADMLDVSVPALKSRLHRGRVLLRQYLSDFLAASKG